MPADARVPPQAAPPFRVDVHPERDAVRVAPAGELDLATAPLLEKHLRELRKAGFQHVVLDLRQLTFIDSRGIRVVVAEHHLAEQAERRFSLIYGPPAVQRALEVSGLLGVLHRDTV